MNNQFYKISMVVVSATFSFATVFSTMAIAFTEETTVVGNSASNSQAQVVAFEEESTVVGESNANTFGEESTVVGESNSNTFGEESTVVGGSNSNTFGEESTVVGGSNSATSTNGFGEESTVVGGSNSNTATTTSSRGSSRGSTGQFTQNSDSEGEVLGATTDNSCAMLTTFMKQETSNNVQEVMMLQSFLNTQGANLPITGFFGPMTHVAVNNFQLKYKEQILTPWVNIGLHSSSDIPTGYVYKTTQYTINKMLCPNAEIPYPTLN